jgi:uncharacterized protein involved in exopolysaccharide biosynthesis
MDSRPLHETPDSGSSDDPSISMIEIAATILRNWRVIVILPVVLGLVAGVWAYSRDRAYIASASFIPQTAEGRAGSGTAALAQQFGLSLGYDRPGESPQFYVDLLRSRAVLRQAVETEYRVTDHAGVVRGATLMEVYEVRHDPRLPQPWRQAVDALRRNLSTSVAGTGLVQLTVAAPEPQLAEQIAARLLELLNDFNLAVRQGRAQDEGRFVAGRVEEAQAELLAAEGRLQAFLSQNRLFESSPDLRFEHERLQRQVAIRQDLYTSLLRAGEQNRMDALRDTPLLTVIDHPAGTAEPQPRGTISRALLAFLLGLTLAVLAAFVGEYMRRSRETDPHYPALEGVARDAWEDLRQPARWVGRGRSRRGDRLAAGDH